MFIALRHQDNLCITIGVHSPDAAGELVARATLGDTFHKLELASTSEEVMQQINEQLELGRYKEVQ